MLIQLRTLEQDMHLSRPASSQLRAVKLRATVLAGFLLAAVSVIAPLAASATIRTPIISRGAWTVYHHDNAHTGYDPTLGQVQHIQAGWVSPTMDAQVYASPLVYGGIVYAATLNNTVYAFNQIDGSLIWSKHLRAPESSGWSCGNVSPQGILGTPVIDPGTSRIYVATLDGGDDKYRLEGLRLSDGLEQVNTLITAPASGFDWTIEQERGALAVANGYVYVPFGGRAGDCGNYHGYVFAVPTDGSAVTHYYQTPGQGMGIWSGGGVVVDDSTGKVFVTTGNGTGSGCDNNVDGTAKFENDAVVRLSSTLAHEDAFYPEDWQNNWCGNDMDLGSASAVILSPSLMFASGKWGTGFLLNPNSLGGMGGQLYPAAHTDTADTCLGNHSDATFGSYAYAAPYVYVECEGQGLVGISVNTGTPSFSDCDPTCGLPDWNAGCCSTFGPPIVAGGMVYAATSGGGLFAFRALSGAPFYQSASFGINRFVTLAEAGGQLFVPSHTVIRSFNLLTGTSQSVPGTPPSRPTGPFQVPTATPNGRQAVPQSTPVPPPLGR